GRHDISIIHQTGEKDIDEVKKTYEWYGIRAAVLPFIENMADAYSKADVVIGRAGAGTIAEITALGKPSILVPYPFSTYGHQSENAMIMKRAGASLVVEDKDATPARLVEILRDLLKDDILGDMAKSAKSLGRPNAAKDIVDELHKLINIPNHKYQIANS
ncbi:MAG: UDP-N-acetylglucosamine--N-acetylmuramyl-(pentapeptide) pyrophosphoryl-undecaprenol N-acetylglucosamine transferase, partial [Thermodesulfobacteriota bacterium]